MSVRKSPLLKNSVFLIILTFFSVISCSKNHIPDTASQNSEPEETFAWDYDSSEHDIPNWIPGDYPRIAVLFGHGYTKDGDETAERERIVSALEHQFGLAENDGLVLPFVFDSTYIDGKPIRLAYISELLADCTLDGLVVVSSPERTHAALTRLADNGATYPVYSVFPQDENLETEGASTFVLDFSRAVAPGGSTDEEIQALNSEEQGGYTGDVATVLISVVQTIKSRASHSFEGETVATQMKAIVELLQKEMTRQGERCTIEPFYDPETGIRAQNHYVIVRND